MPGLPNHLYCHDIKTIAKKYRVSNKSRSFFKIKNISDLLNDDKEGEIKENIDLNILAIGRRESTEKNRNFPLVNSKLPEIVD